MKTLSSKNVYRFILSAMMILSIGLNANSQIQFEAIAPGQGADFEKVRKSSIAFFDIDGDGDEDVLITGENAAFAPTAKLYSNDGGIFTLVDNTPFIGVTDASLALSDIDGDGDEDVLITGRDASSLPSSNLYTNDGGNFTLMENTPFEGVSSGSIAFSDVDGDGDEDVLITGRTSLNVAVSQLYSNDGGDFTLVANTPFAAVDRSSIAFSDLDGDGDEDVLITGFAGGPRISKLYSNESGNFTLVANTPFTGVAFGSVAFSDVDGDGDEDVVITGANAEGSISSLYSNNGGGNFTLVPNTMFVAVSGSSIAFSDVDGDGDEDLLITGVAPSSYHFSMLYSNEGGNFTLVPNTPFAGVFDSSVAFSDVDGDGDEDLLITGYGIQYGGQYVNYATLYRNLADTTDTDNDGVWNDVDNCPFLANAEQADADGDGLGDVCDECPNDPANDIDGDGICDGIDDCVDVDQDGICIEIDNCPNFANADQTDADGDGLGDVCDECPNDPDNDADNDGICDDLDDCVGFVDTLGVCVGNCVNPFPAVIASSMLTTFLGPSYLAEWDPVPGQTGCLGQLTSFDGVLIKQITLFGEDVSSQLIPGYLLESGTTYKWRVRCGCSFDPLVVGPFTTFRYFTTPSGPGITASPNPTEGQSNVTFTVVEQGRTTLEVYDLSGRLVESIFTGIAQPDAEYRFAFDGSALANGVYIYRLTTEHEIVNEKFMIAR